MPGGTTAKVTPTTQKFSSRNSSTEFDRRSLSMRLSIDLSYLENLAKYLENSSSAAFRALNHLPDHVDGLGRLLDSSARELDEVLDQMGNECEPGRTILRLYDADTVRKELKHLFDGSSFSTDANEISYQHCYSDRQGSSKLKRDMLYPNHEHWNGRMWRLGYLSKDPQWAIDGYPSNAHRLTHNWADQQRHFTRNGVNFGHLINSFVRACSRTRNGDSIVDYVFTAVNPLPPFYAPFSPAQHKNFFANPSNSNQSGAYESALNKLFDKYRDDAQNNPDTIFTEGAMNYFKDVQISVEDIGVLLISELLTCPTLGEITRQGFVSGWSNSGATTVSAQRSQLSTLFKQLPQPDSRGQGGRFRRVYKHTFKLACPPGSKSVPLEMATEYWKILFSKQGMEWVSNSGKPWLEWWLAFLDEKWKKAVNRDMWDQTLLFALKSMEDDTLSWWSEESAWPGIIDEFVGWVKKKGVGTSDDKSMDVD